MSTEKLALSMTTRPTRKPFLSYQAERIMDIGEEHGWPFHIIGVAPVPSRPVFHNNWWLVPLQQDNTDIPTRARERVRTILASGVYPKAIIIAHEAPPQLPAPTVMPKLPSSQATTLGSDGQPSTAAVLSVGAISALGALALAFLGLVMIDPALIVITQDDVWIALDAWIEHA